MHISSSLFRIGVLTVGSVFMASLLSGCGTYSANPSAADAAGKSVGCENFKSDFFNSVYDFPLNKKSLPQVDAMEPAFARGIENGRMKNASPTDRAAMVKEMRALYQLISSEVANSGNPRKSRDVLRSVASLEIGDASTREKKLLQIKIYAALSRIQNIADESIGTESCSSAPAPSPVKNTTAASGTMLDQWKTSRHPIVYGGFKSLATAYQSCSAGYKRPVDKSVVDTAGIKIIGLHADGVGNRRIVSDLPAFLKTQYYMKDDAAPGAGCFNVRASPLIYDYGGRPFATSDANARLNLFKDAGDGTSVLGIDCSGYVYTAMATAGQRIRRGERMKPINVMGISSTMYNTPGDSDMSCMDFLDFTPTKTIREGDIMATEGHVVIIESVGADPWGIASINDDGDCTMANMSVKRFNFSILQSSPNKNGIGISRTFAADYFEPEMHFYNGVLEFAVQACHAKLRNKTIEAHAADATLTRHSDDSECQESPVLLTNEECISSCPAQ